MGVLLTLPHVVSANSLCVFAGSVRVWPLEVRPGEGKVSRKRSRNRFGTGPLTPLGCEADIGVSALMYALVWPLEWEGTWKKDGLLPHTAQPVKWITITVGRCWCFFETVVIYRKFCIAKSTTGNAMRCEAWSRHTAAIDHQIKTTQCSIRPFCHTVYDGSGNVEWRRREQIPLRS